MKKLLIVVLITFMSWKVLAQHPGYQIGQKIEKLSLPTEAGGQAIPLDFTNRKAVVIIFTNNQCPYSRLYQKRLLNLTSNYTSKGVSFIFIKSAIGTEKTNNPINEASDNSKLKNMADFNYLTDTDQKISKEFGATRTPEVFVLQPENNALVLRYKGAIDDNPQVETHAKESYLQEALDAVLNNQLPVVTQKRAIGCMIKHF